MTCIVSLKQDDKIYIGGDTAAVAGLSVNVRLDTKVFKNKKMLIGYAGSFRFGQLMRFAFKPPKHETGKDDYEYMCVDVVRSMQKCFGKHGFDGQNKKDEKETSGQMLIAYKGQLYEVYEDYQVGIPADSFVAIGCGGDLALGAMEALQNVPNSAKISAEDKINIALGAAAKFNGGVLPPFNIMSI
jgi:ATP-dependent protease HslVU (ClpYQ) peptidase subunit